jgi:hypothetical protein
MAGSQMCSGDITVGNVIAEYIHLQEVLIQEHQRGLHLSGLQIVGFQCLRK